jgi:hypothetical protein
MHHEMTGMFASFMQRYDPAACQVARDHFPLHAFFGFSATGCHAVKSGRQGSREFPYIKPLRVMEPLWWQLAEMNIIPSFDTWVEE